MKNKNKQGVNTMQVEPNLSIFKKGDDLNFLLEKHPPIEAIKAYAEMLRENSDLLYKIVRHLTVDNGKVEIQADCHFISIDCSDEVAQKMIEDDLVSKMEDWEEDDSEEERDDIFPGKKVAIHLNNEIGKEKYAVEYIDDSIDKEFQCGYWIDAFDTKEEALGFIKNNDLVYDEEDFYSTI